MNQFHTRRKFLRTGMIAGAGTAAVLGLGGIRALAGEADRWGYGVPPGQDLPPEATSGPWKNMRGVKAKKVFDVHVHCYETPLQGSNYAETGVQHHRDVWKNYVNELIASMDRHGVALAALNPAFTDFEEIYKTAFLPHKDRFILSAGTPTTRTKSLGDKVTPADVAALYKEQLSTYGARFVGETAGGALVRLIPNHPMKDLKPIVDVVLEHDVPVQIHTGWTPTGTGINYGRPYQTDDDWAKTIGSFMSAYPDVKVILAHTGGQYQEVDGWQAIRLLYSFDNAYCDTAKSPAEIITAAVKGVGPERVLFGSDWNRPEMKAYGPFYLRAAYQQWWNLNNVAMADITEDQRDWVLYKSAHKLLKLDPA